MWDSSHSVSHEAKAGKELSNLTVKSNGDYTAARTNTATERHRRRATATSGSTRPATHDALTFRDSYGLFERLPGTRQARAAARSGAKRLASVGFAAARFA
jgi:hypothetical protein